MSQVYDYDKTISFNSVQPAQHRWKIVDVMVDVGVNVDVGSFGPGCASVVKSDGQHKLDLYRRRGEVAIDETNTE
jgi:hypothetical protein